MNAAFAPLTYDDRIRIATASLVDAARRWNATPCTCPDGATEHEEQCEQREAEDDLAMATEAYERIAFPVVVVEDANG